MEYCGGFLFFLCVYIFVWLFVFDLLKIQFAFFDLYQVTAQKHWNRSTVRILQQVFDIIVFEKPTDQKLFVNYVYFDNKQNAANFKNFSIVKKSSNSITLAENNF